MKTFDIVTAGPTQARSLYQLVEDNMKKYLDAAIQNSNSFINNVSDQLRVTANEAILNSVIGGMLHAVVAHVKESHILVSAKEIYGKMIEINVKDDNCYNTYAVALSLQDAFAQAEKIGGRLDITNQRQKITTISFTFPVEPADESKTGY
ncbi:MAG TPA: hypothetical protein VIZ28_05105 [Chitinophagaceae bacterium]